MLGPAGRTLALVAHPLPALATAWSPLRAPLGIHDWLATPDGVVLTFDDGPHPQGTPAVLELLAATGANATFFLVGEQIERYPALAAEIAAAGHEIGLHCHRHHSLLTLTSARLESDCSRALAAIADATGRRPRLYRPPYGLFSAAGLLLARHYRLQPLLWTRWGRDWEAQASPSSIAERLTRRVRAGDVLLLHDADHYSAPGSWRNTVAALPTVLDRLAQRNLAPAPIPATRARPQR